MLVSFVVKLSFQSLDPIVVLCFLAFIVGVDFIISGIIPSFTKIKNDRKNIGCSAVMQVQALKGFDKIISTLRFYFAVTIIKILSLFGIRIRILVIMSGSIFLPKILHSGISSNSKMAFFFLFFPVFWFFFFLLLG